MEFIIVKRLVDHLVWITSYLLSDYISLTQQNHALLQSRGKGQSAVSDNVISVTVADIRRMLHNCGHIKYLSWLNQNELYT